MFKKKDLDTLLGIGRVRAPIATMETEPISTLESETIAANETDIAQEKVIKPETETASNVSSESMIETTPSVNPSEKLLTAYESQIAFLQQQLAVKDEQLSSKDDIIKNFQVLLKLEQDTVLKLTHKIEESKAHKGWKNWFKTKEPVADSE